VLKDFVLKKIKYSGNIGRCFDGPHPGNELYKYQVEKIKQFIDQIGEKED
jgi:hypothetical protein